MKSVFARNKFWISHDSVRSPSVSSIRFFDGKVGRRLLVASIGAATILGIVMAIGAPVEGDDASFHLHWITAFYDLLRQGILIPKWLPDGFQGFGAPTFYFYPPLTYYVSSFLIWLTGIHSPEAIFNFSGLVSTLGSGAACYYLLRTLDTSKSVSLLGGLFYAFAPYRQFDLITRSSLSQPMGFIFLPVVLAGLCEVVRAKKDARWSNLNLSIVIGWAGLLLCALPLAVAASMTILVLWLAEWRSVTKRDVSAIALSFVLGSTLVAFHYLPAFYFQRYVQSNTYLVGIPDGNWLPALLHGTEVRFVVQDLLVYATQVGILICCWKISRAFERPAFSRSVFVVVAFWVAIETPYLSSPLWDHLYLFHLLRFHARFDIFAVLLLSILAFSPVAGLGWQRFGRPVVIAWSGIACLLALTVLFHIQAHPHGTSQWMDSPEYLPLTTRPATVAMDGLFLPHVHDPFVFSTPPLSANESMQLTARTPTSATVNVDFVNAHNLIFHQFIWPTWKCLVDGREVRMYSDSLGRVRVPLFSGTHTITLQLETSGVEKAGIWLSGVTLVFLLFFALIRAMRPRSKPVEAGGHS